RRRYVANGGLISASRAAVSPSVRCRRRSTRAATAPSIPLNLLYIQKDLASPRALVSATTIPTIQTRRLRRLRRVSICCCCWIEPDDIICRYSDTVCSFLRRTRNRISLILRYGELERAGKGAASNGIKTLLSQQPSGVSFPLHLLNT